MPRAQVQTFRSTTKGTRPVAGDSPLPGEVYVNYADRQLGIVNSDATTNIDLIAVRFFSVASDYAVGDYVVQAGTLYRCTTAVTAGSFNGANWTAVGSGGGGGVTDGDKGDIVVSASGATWLFDSSVVTAAAKTVLDDTTVAAMRTTLGAAATAHTHSQSDVTNLVSDLAAKAAIASPALTGTPTAPTAAAGTNTTQLATTAFVAASYAPLASPALTGTPTAPTPTAGTNDTKLATTAFVTAAIAAGGGGGGLLDGDKGDVVVSGSGTVWTFDTAVVTAAAKTVLDDTSVGAMRTTLGAFASTGGTITGNVTMAPPSGVATFSIDDKQALSVANASIFNWQRNAKNRFAMFLDGAEPGNDSKSDWKVARYFDDGSFRDIVFQVARADATATFFGPLSVGGALSVGTTLAVTGSSTLTGQLTLGASAPFVAPYIFNNVGGASANMVVASNGVVNKISSMRILKKDIAPLDDAAGDAVLALKPSTFRFKQDAHGYLHYGFIADELAAADACFATWDYEPNRDADGALILTPEGSVTLSDEVVANAPDSVAIIAGLVNLVQRLERRIAALEAA